MLTASGAGADPFAYVSNFRSPGLVSVVDAACSMGQPCVLKKVTVGGLPSGVAVNPAGTFAYVANNEDGTVTVIQTSDNTPVPGGAIVVGPGPWGVAVSADNSKVYVGLSDGSVALIDVNNSNAVTPIPNVGGMLNGLAVAGSRAYVTDATSGQVAVIEGANVVKRITVGALTTAPPNGIVNSSPNGVVANAAGTRVYVVDILNDLTEQHLEVSVIDAVTNTLVDSIRIATDTGAFPGGLALSPDGTRVYVAVDALDKVVVASTVTKLVLGEYAVGVAPAGVAIDPTGTRVFVAHLGSATVSVIDTTATSNAVKNITIDAMSFVLGAFATAGPPAPPPPAQYQLSLNAVGNGTISAQPLSPSGTYTAGTVVTLTANAASDSQFTSWSSACTGSSSGNVCTVTMDASKSVTATFTLKQYALTVAKAGNGTGSVSLSPAGGTYSHGATVTLSATPYSGSLFTSWSGCAQQSGATCTVTMDGPKTVTVTFTLKQYTLTVSTAGNGSGSVSLNPTGGTYNHGSIVTLSASPAASSVFTSWSGCTANGSSCSVTMDAAKTVTATFTLKQYSLTVSTTGTGSGTVNPSGGTFSHGTSVSLTATPNAGSQFSGWSVGCSGTANPCSVLMDGPKSVTASFTAAAPPPPVQYQLTLSKDGDGSGSLTPNPSSANGKYNAGTQVGVAHSAAPGSKFVKWAGACSGTGPCSVTMNAAKSVVATFTRASQPPATCDEKIQDWQKKVAERKHPWWQDYQLRISLKMYTEAQSELGKAKAKVGGRDKRYVHAEDEFDNGKSALCHGHYWRADNEFWDAYQIAHRILKQFRR